MRLEGEELGGREAWSAESTGAGWGEGQVRMLILRPEEPEVCEQGEQLPEASALASAVAPH